MKKFVIKKAWLLDEVKNELVELKLCNSEEFFKDAIERENIRGGVGKSILDK